MVSAFVDTTFTFGTDPAFNFEKNDKCQTDGEGKTQNNDTVNNTATRNIHGGKNSMFSGNIFVGTLNIDIVKPSMKKKKKKKKKKSSPSQKKHWRMT